MVSLAPWAWTDASRLTNCKKSVRAYFVKDLLQRFCFARLNGLRNVRTCEEPVWSARLETSAGKEAEVKVMAAVRKGWQRCAQIDTGILGTGNTQRKILILPKVLGRFETVHAILSRCPAVSWQATRMWFFKSDAEREVPILAKETSKKTNIPEVATVKRRKEAKRKSASEKSAAFNYGSEAFVARAVLVARVEQAVLSALPARLSEEVLAKAVGVEVKELHNAFKEACGVDFYTAMRGLRVAEVKRRLDADKTLPVEAAMRQCGFPNYTWFRRDFLDMFGIDPRFFRMPGDKTRRKPSRKGGNPRA